MAARAWRPRAYAQDSTALSQPEETPGLAEGAGPAQRQQSHRDRLNNGRHRQGCAARRLSDVMSWGGARAGLEAASEPYGWGRG